MRPLLTALSLTALGLASIVACSDGPTNPEAIGEGHSLTARAATPPRLALQRAFAGAAFTQPLALLQAPGDAARFYVVEKGGTVTITTNSGGGATFADLRSRVNPAGEGGLLGMAFHPRFSENGEVFLSYTARSATSPANLRSVVARAKATSTALDPSTIVELVTFDQPYTNHNGGNIAFGPDALLYAGFGDGGAAGDPHGNGQDKNTLLGKMLRLDVDHGSPFAIPSDNPFASGGGKPEIFAYGLRNPWRFSFDRERGDLWVGDVGQGAWEEVDKVVLGGNYGWGTREGNHCFGAATCANLGLPPVVEYGRAEGKSITGGYVYRGRAIPGLAGFYLYGDYMSGKIWAIASDEAAPAQRTVLQGRSISSFGEDLAGELYVVNIQSGQIDKIVAAP
jgi:glucose/arabinose dehydrogenase